MVIPTLNKLRALAKEGDKSSLEELSTHWRQNSRRERGKKEGSPGHGWAAGSPRSGPSRAGRGGHPLQGPNAALKNACGDV